MTLRLAQSPDSWGVWFPSHPDQIDYREYLDEIAELGFKGTELGPHGYMPTDAKRLRTELLDRGITATASFVMRPLSNADAYRDIEREVLQVGALIAELGGRYLVLIDDGYRDLATGAMVGPRNLPSASWAQLLGATDRLGGLVRDRFGLRLVFHPHADTYVERVDQAELLLAGTDPTAVGLCLDLGHLAYRGDDPIAVLERSPDRVAYLHLKSVSAVVREQVLAEDLSLVEAVRRGVFVEPQLGVIDFQRLSTVLEGAQFEGWACIEQDMEPTRRRQAPSIAKRTLEYFTQIGLGSE